MKGVRNVLLGCCLVFSLIGGIQNPLVVRAATITVTSTADSGTGSLRAAIASAADGDTINFSLSTPATITLTSEIAVNKDLTLTGLGSSVLTIDGGGTTRIFNISAGTLRISGITFSNGYMRGEDATYNTPGTYNGAGGAVYIASGAGMTATNVVFSYNYVRGGNGGDSHSDTAYYGGAGGGAGGVPLLDGNFGGGGGGGYASFAGGTGGYGGGGGGSQGGQAGGLGGTYGGNGGDGSSAGAGYSGGGGGAGMGGAIYVDAGGALGLNNVTLSNNVATGGTGGNANTSFTGSGGGGGAALGSAIFNRGSLCLQTGVFLSNNNLSAGAGGAGKCAYYSCGTNGSAGQTNDTSTGIHSVGGDTDCGVWYNSPTDITFTPVSLSEGQPVGTNAGSFTSADPDAGDTFTYTLVSGSGSTDNASFAISGSSLVTNAILDYEAKSTYSVRIRTTDSHNRYYEKSFTLTITDANDPPTNISLSGNTTAENQPSGTAVGTLTSTDAESSVFTYSLATSTGCSGTDNASFKISGSELQTNAALDFETKETYEVCIRSTDSGSPAQSLDKAFTITVTDANDTPTNITLSNSSVTEEVASGATVGTLSATDQDTADSFTYILSSGTGCSGTDNAAFTIAGDVLKSAQVFDYETKSSYTICVQTTDSGTPNLSFMKQLTVSVANVNDAPTDITLSHNAVIENLAAGTTVGTLTSSDIDNTTFTYSLVTAAGCDGTDNASFSISADTLKTVGSMDYETKNSYTICIRSTDTGTPPLSYDKQFTITVTEANDPPSTITLSNNTVAENQTTGTVVGTLTSTDQDSSVFTYSLATSTGCSGTDNASFKISGTELQTNASLDFETKSSLSVCIRSTDDGSPAQSFDKAFTITVTNNNDSPTNITLSNSSITEELASGTTVGTLNSTDQDFADTFTYAFSTGTGCPGTDNASFTIAGDVLKSAEVFNYETKSSYTLCVQTTDSGTPNLSFLKQLTVTVTNVNDTPTDITLSSSSLVENLPAGTTVGTLSTSDVDNTTFTYSLVTAAGCDGTDNASFSIDGDALKTVGVMDYEAKHSYAVCIRTTDTGTPPLSFDKHFTITVTDTNDPPTEITLSNNTVAENQPSGTIVGTLTSTDQDGGHFTFSLATSAGCSGTDNASFKISGNELQTNASLDFEAKSSLSVCVRSTDDGTPPLSMDKAFTITVTNGNDTPTNITLSGNSIAEAEGSGTTVGTFTTTDQDTVDTFTYALSSGTGCSGAGNASFTIAGDVLKSAEVFNYETKSSYTICVQTSDSGTPNLSFLKQFTITVTNVNEGPTDITLSKSSLAEHLPGGTTVGTLTTSDVDNTTFTYSLVTTAGCSGTDNVSFTIDGSALKAAISFNFEVKNSYTICIRTTDSGTPALSFEKQFIISVTDVNDPPTDITLSNNTVAENQPVGTAVGSFTSTDDNSTVFTYSFNDSTSCHGTDNASFSISGADLKTAAIFDFEAKSSYTVCIRSTDDSSPGLTYDEQFTITITNGNDAPTDITLTPSTIEENKPIGTDVGTFSSTDLDSTNFTYSLATSTGCNGADNSSFTITAGVLKSALIFNYETKHLYTLCVRSADDATPSLSFDKQLSVTVTNANDGPTVPNPIADQSLGAGLNLNYTFPANTFRDEDGDALTYTATLESGDPLPAWLTFTAATRRFSGNNTHIQTLRITLTANDGHAPAVSTTFTFNVANQTGNHVPVLVIALPNAGVNAGNPLNHTFPTNCFVDGDNDALTYSAALSSGAALPAWLSFASGTRTFTGTPAVGDAGSYTVRVAVTDNRGGEKEGDFTLGVGINVAPSVDHPIPNKAASRGVAWSFQFAADTFTDVDGDVLTYTADLSDGSALPAWLSFDPASRTFSGTPPTLVAGSDYVLNIRVTADDGALHTVSDVFKFGSWSPQDVSNNLPTGSQVTVEDSPAGGPTGLPSGATERLGNTVDIQIYYGLDPITNVSGNGIQVCFSISPEESVRIGGDLSRLAIGYSHSGAAWIMLNTHRGSSDTEICADATAFSLFEIFIKSPSSGGGGGGGSGGDDDDDDSDAAVNEAIKKASRLPDTGFAPGVQTILPQQPVDREYTDMAEVWLEIPSIAVQSKVVGVPLEDGDWGVDWLHDAAGWLEGSAFPGKDGNAAIAGHVFDADGNPGIFHHLGNLRWGDQIILHGFKEKLTYEVRTVDYWIAPHNTGILRHEALPWLTLITCHGYDGEKDTYHWRSVVRAVLIQRDME